MSYIFKISLVRVWKSEAPSNADGGDSKDPEKAPNNRSKLKTQANALRPKHENTKTHT